MPGPHTHLHRASGLPVEAALCTYAGVRTTTRGSARAEVGDWLVTHHSPYATLDGGKASSANVTTIFLVPAVAFDALFEAIPEMPAWMDEGA